MHIGNPPIAITTTTYCYEYDIKLQTLVFWDLVYVLHHF